MMLVGVLMLVWVVSTVSKEASKVTPTAAKTTTKPSPVVVKPTPVVLKPTPVVTKPTPVVTKPTPVVLKPTPVVAKPNPVVTKPTPIVTKPTPVVVKPTPVVVKPTPIVTKPTTNGTYPRMEGNVVPINNTNTPYTAGKDIPVGLYHSTNSACGFMVRMTDKTLFSVSVFQKGSTLVELKAGEQVLNAGCSIVFGPPTMQDVLLPGSHLVNVDILPGVYHSENNLSCEFALSSKDILVRGSDTIKVGFGDLNGVRDMLIPATAEGVLFSSDCGKLTKVG